MKHDRVSPCVECPFKPDGYIGKLPPEVVIDAIKLHSAAFPCHMSYGQWRAKSDGTLAFHYLERCSTKMQQCAGYLIFASNIGVGLDRESMRRMIFGFPKSLLGEQGGSLQTVEQQMTLVADDRVFKTVEEFLQYYQAGSSR